jgi:acetyl/propionyl-CoA carboxylase alpha subunit
MTTRYFRIAGRDHEVEILEQGDGRIDALVDGERVEASFSARGAVIELRYEERIEFVHTARSGPCFSCCVSGTSVQVAAGVPRTSGSSAPLLVTPATPSMVARVLVEVGQGVERGQGVVVLSAMKMETTLVAPCTGRVTAVRVSQGDQVMPGDELVVVKPLEE